MIRPRRAALVGSLALLLAIAGCLSGAPWSGAPSSASPAPTSPPDAATTSGAPAGTPERSTTPPGFREAPTTPEPLAGRANCSDDLWVSFWGLNDARLWNANEVRYGTYLPPNASLLFVAYVNGTVGGVHADGPPPGGGGVHVDGGSVEVEDDLAGEHAARIVVHQDVDRDGSFDRETDLPCYNDRGLVQTEYLLIDFDHYW